MPSTFLRTAAAASEQRSELRTIRVSTSSAYKSSPLSTLEAALALLLCRYSGDDTVRFVTATAGGTAVMRSVQVQEDEVAADWLATQAAQRQQQLRVQAAATDALADVDIAIDLPGTRALTVLTKPELSLRYDTSRIQPAAAERAAGHLSSLLAALLGDTARKVGELPMLSAAEHEQLLVDFNQTARPFPDDKCIHHLFEQRASAQPDAIAVCCGAARLSYAELDRRSNQLAHYLRELGVGTDVPVGVFTDRSLEMAIAIVGVLKAGGAYAPIDPSYPAERVAFMMGDVGAPVLLTQTHLLDRLPDIDTRLVALDASWPKIEKQPSAAPAVEHHPENLAYIIYTSGSTGLPKGIAIRHRGALNNIYDLNSRYRVGPTDSMLVLSSLSFDMCVYEVLGSLTAGATMIMTDLTLGADPAHWAALVQEHGVTIWNSAPQLLEMFISYVEGRPELHPRSLRLTILGGDWVPVNLPDRFKAVVAVNAQVIVLGGATEASIHSTIFEVERTQPEWKSIPYGRPMFNQTCYVLDERQRLCPIGIPGELHLGGTGLARGYLNRPELTSKKFIDHPFIEAERLYRTGDRVVLDEAGCLQLLGRIDFMVKIRGQRIELGEVEAALRRQQSVREAVVMVRADDAVGDQRLTAYLVLESAGGDAAGELAVQTEEQQRELLGRLRQTLGHALPDYMVPGAFVVLDALPLTPNGKVNRRALPAPQSAARRGLAEMIPPRDALEQVVANAWAEVLGLEKISIHDNFFELGGHSLSATRIVARLWDILVVELQLTQLFRSPTVAELAEHIRRVADKDNVDIEAIAELAQQVDGLSDDELEALLEAP